VVNFQLYKITLFTPVMQKTGGLSSLKILKFRPVSTKPQLIQSI